MIRRRILIVVLAIGTVAGFSAGFRSMRHCQYNQGPRHGGFDRFDRNSAYADGFAAGARACAEAAHEK